MNISNGTLTSFSNLDGLSVHRFAIHYAYDADGLPTVVSDGASAVSNGWDAATGGLVKTRGAEGTEVGYLYRNDGAVTSVVSVAGVKSLDLDPYGRWTRAESAAGTADFGYSDWNGLAAAVTNGATVVEYAYDVMDRVTNVAWRTASGGRLGGLSYAYDAIGRIVSRRHDLGGVRLDRDYAYDAADRLASDGDISYAYDAAGNRLSRTGGGGAVAYAYGPGDRLAAWTGGSYEHDAAGCVTRIVRGGVAMDLRWDGLYRLVSVATNGVPAESYAYDALGRRVATTAAEGTERHVYDDRWQVIADLDADGRVVRSYVWGEGVDRLLAVRIGARTYAALTDEQGTVWGFADGGGRIAARWTYDAWGNVLSEEIAPWAGELRAVRYRFQGRERSAATGLVHFRARWYDPVTGRWLSPDPIGLEGGLNLHAFCANDPVNYTDPSGCSWWDEYVTDPLVNLVLAHWNRNRGRNEPSQLPSSPQDATKNHWRKLLPSESVYHNRYGACNTKYVSPDGHQEAVYDSCGKLVTDPINGGTYNKYGPDNWIGHFFYDMLPYYLFGNSPVDAFDHWDRVKATYESIQYSLEPLQSMLQELKRKVGL